MTTRARHSDAAAGLLQLTGGLLMMTVAIMLIAPGFFHRSWAGFGTLNTHFIRDAATFAAALGVALWMSASRPGWRKPVLALALVQNGLHIVNHIADVASAEPGWQGPANLALLAVFQMVLWWVWRLDGRLRSDTSALKVSV